MQKNSLKTLQPGGNLMYTFWAISLTTLFLLLYDKPKTKIAFFNKSFAKSDRYCVCFIVN